MPGRAADVDADPYGGIDLLRIAREETFKTAIRGLNDWKDNISTGTGAAGNRRPWVNTGEARADLAISPQEPSSLEYLVGGDVVQLFIAEFGRAPNNTPPPVDVIARWVQEKGIASPGQPDFDGVVYAIGQAIARDGIKGFAPGLQAAHTSVKGAEARIAKRIQEELERAS